MEIDKAGTRGREEEEGRQLERERERWKLERERRKEGRELLEEEIPANSLEKSDGLAAAEHERDQNPAQDVQQKRRSLFYKLLQ